MSSDDPDLKWKVAAAVLSVAIVAVLVGGVLRGGFGPRGEPFQSEPQQQVATQPTPNTNSPTAATGGSTPTKDDLPDFTNRFEQPPSRAVIRAIPRGNPGSNVAVISALPESNGALYYAILSRYTKEYPPQWLLHELFVEHATREELTNAVMATVREHFKAEGKPPPDWLVDVLNGPGFHGTITVTIPASDSK
jgi:hypothetical protein